MKRTSSMSKSLLFLMELLLSFFILSLCTTVFVRLFAASWENRKKAREANHIQEILTNSAEIFEASDGSAAVFQHFFPYGIIDKEDFLNYYTSVWNTATDTSDAAYKVQLSPRVFDNYKTLSIHIWHLGRNEELIFETEVRFPILSQREAQNEKAE